MISRSVSEPGAFAAIFDRHFDAVHRYLTRRIGRPHAEDLAASTFTVAFARRGRFRADADTARPWLLGIATNLLRNELRSQRRGLELLSRLGRGLTTSSPERTEGLDHLVPLLRELEADQLDVLLLYAWEELSYEQIASALGIPIGTVRSRLARARSHLRARLEAADAGGAMAREASR